MTEAELIELLADKEHAGWAHWMRYLFAVSRQQADGSVVIPAALVEHWQGQVKTPYAALSEKEKQSDREQVAEIMPIIKAFAQSKQDLTIYATIEQGTTSWLARILEPGKEPYYFQPGRFDWIVAKGDLVLVVNRAYPGVTYISAEAFAQAMDAQKEAHQS